MIRTYTNGSIEIVADIDGTDYTHVAKSYWIRPNGLTTPEKSN